MKKYLVIASLLVIAAVPAAADVHVNASVVTGHTAISFSTEPAVVVVPNSHVYYCEYPQYDVYRYGRSWWVDRGGTWYRASSYRGPFVAVSYERVPHQIVVVPAEYHRHDNGRHVGWEKHHKDRDHRDEDGDRGDHGD